MKKRILPLTLALCAVCAAAAFAQQGAGGGAVADVSMLNINVYNSYFNNGKTKSGKVDIRDERYLNLPSDDDYYKFSGLGGDAQEVDTELEFALLSYYSQPVVNIRPVDAANMLPARSKASEIQLAAWAAIELAVLRFTNPGSPSIGKYEGILHFIKGRQTESTSDDITQNEINAAVRQIVSAEVDAQFKGLTVSISTLTEIKQVITKFYLTPNPINFSALEFWNIILQLAGQQVGIDNIAGLADAWSASPDTAKLATTFRDQAKKNQGELNKVVQNLDTQWQEQFKKIIRDSKNMESGWNAVNQAYIESLKALSPALAQKVQK
jgi:hypothetical protein